MAIVNDRSVLRESTFTTVIDDTARWPDQHPRTKQWRCACCGQPGRLYPRGPRCNDCLHPQAVTA